MFLKTVLLICNRVPHYRVSVYNYLHRRFRQCGWDFQVASDSLLRESRQPLQFEFHEMPFRFASYRKLVNSVNPDVVMLHLHLKLPIFWQLLHWLKFTGRPMVHWTKGANLDQPNSKLRHWMFNYAHWLCDALVLYSARQTECLAPVNRAKVFAANNTVNFEDYPEVTESRAQIKAEFNLPFEKMVLFVGTMGVDGERKKVDHLIEIFGRLSRPDIGLVLVGGGMSDDRKARLNPKNTRYLGRVHDPQNVQISKLFKAADVFVVPGHVGLGLNQAFYWGLPAITEDCHQPPEIQYLKSGRNGFLVPENDLEGLQEKMLDLLDNDVKRSEFSRHAREDILKDASIEGMFQGFHQAVQFVLKVGGGEKVTCGNTAVSEVK